MYYTLLKTMLHIADKIQQLYVIYLQFHFLLTRDV